MRVTTVCAALTLLALPALARSEAVVTPACRPSLLELTRGPDLSPATGQNPLSFLLTNRGSGVCLLEGYPSIALFDRRGSRLPFRISHKGDQMVTSRRSVAVRVLPRHSAFLVINKYRCDLGDLRLAKTLRVALPGIRTSARLTAGILGSIGYCGKGDPGSIVTVSPFEPTLRAALKHG
jgi:hypothetical protein